MPRPTASYSVTITRSVTDPDWLSATLRKQWWRVGTGTTSRHVATAGFYTQGMGEAEIVESALRELLRALCDEIA